MASQVLSGSSNPTYTNNTGQNVRVVINYMQGSRFSPFVPGIPSTIRSIGTPDTPAVISTLTINWAGVSATSSSDLGQIVIGRNLAYSNLYRDSATGRVLFGTTVGSSLGTAGETPITPSIAIAVSANNASGTCALPTELILAPGQTFSAVCGVHNVVIIPEAG